MNILSDSLSHLKKKKINIQLKLQETVVCREHQAPALGFSRLALGSVIEISSFELTF